MADEPRRRVEVAVEQRATTGFLSSLRLSGFAFVVLGLVIMAVFVLAPGLKTYVEQQQQLAELQADVAAAEQRVDDLTEQRERWSDPAYVRAQIKERLYYVEPGDYSALVIKAGKLAREDAQPRQAASDDVEQTEVSWGEDLLQATLYAGLGAPGAENDPTSLDPDIDADEG